MSTDNIVTLAPLVTFSILAGLFIWVCALELCARFINRSQHPSRIAEVQQPIPFYEADLVEAETSLSIR